MHSGISTVVYPKFGYAKLVTNRAPQDFLRDVCEDFGIAVDGGKDSLSMAAKAGGLNW